MICTSPYTLLNVLILRFLARIELAFVIRVSGLTVKGSSIEPTAGLRFTVPSALYGAARGVSLTKPLGTPPPPGVFEYDNALIVFNPIFTRLPIL